MTQATPFPTPVGANTAVWTALVSLTDDGIGILKVLSRREIEKNVDAQPVQTGYFGGKVTGIAHGIDTVQLGLERLYTFGIGCAFVDARTVVVADFLIDGIAVASGGGGLLQDLPQHGGIAFTNVDKA